MSMRKIWPTGWRAIVLLLVGSVMGANLITPAVAHIGTVTHLWTKHIRPKADTRYANAVAGTDKAKDADKLDGLDSSQIGPRAFGVVNAFGGPAFHAGRPVKNLTGVSRPSTGIYCITVDPASGIDPTTATVIVSVEWGNASGSDLLAFWQGAVDAFACPAGEIEIRTYKFSGGLVLSDVVSFSLAVL